MTELYKHQLAGIPFLAARRSAALFWEMGLGKSRTALLAAHRLYREKQIDRVLILAPKAVCYAWTEELTKLELDEIKFNLVVYNSEKRTFIAISPSTEYRLPILLVSYSLLPQERHRDKLMQWCRSGKTALVCDESSFLKSRNAKQVRSATKIAGSCRYRWLLTGTPIANSVSDLYGQTLVMIGQRATSTKAFKNGPLAGFCGFSHFQARYVETQPMKFGAGRVFRREVGVRNLDELQAKYAPYVSRLEKKDALDLPAKTYSAREIELDDRTWKIYQELKREAMLALPDTEEIPQPNAAVRILRLCQLTSGHVGVPPGVEQGLLDIELDSNTQDTSCEKLDFVVKAVLDGELSHERALIIWCRWRRERERLQQMLAQKIEVYRIFGGQQDRARSFELQNWKTSQQRRVLVAQQQAGGYGLTLTEAKCVVYLSNTFSHVVRTQSEDRNHRIGQLNPVTYYDYLAVGPRGQRTLDHYILEVLKEKKDLATMTCAAWREALEDE